MRRQLLTQHRRQLWRDGGDQVLHGRSGHRQPGGEKAGIHPVVRGKRAARTKDAQAILAHPRRIGVKPGGPRFGPDRMQKKRHRDRKFRKRSGKPARPSRRTRGHDGNHFATAPQLGRAGGKAVSNLQCPHGCSFKLRAKGVGHHIHPILQRPADPVDQPHHRAVGPLVAQGKRRDLCVKVGGGKGRKGLFHPLNMAPLCGHTIGCLMLSSGGFRQVAFVTRPATPSQAPAFRARPSTRSGFVGGGISTPVSLRKPKRP